MVQVVDLFAGGGGASEGFTRAECDVVLAIDAWPEALQVHALNHPLIKHKLIKLGGCIRSTAAYIRNHLKKGEHFHLHGSPPCQALSNASRRDSKEGLFLVEWFLELVEYMKPDSWSMENVVPLGKWLRSEGVPHQIINAAEFGVPQARRRVFAGEGWTITPSDRVIGVLDALPYLRTEFKSILPHVFLDAGRSSAKTSGVNPNTGKKEGGSGFLCKHIREPSYTIMSTRKRLVDLTSGVPVKLRFFTPQEKKILQGWAGMKHPDSLKMRDFHLIVGNMVCPPITEAIGRSIKEAFE